MDEQLPEINQPKRIQISEEDLTSRPATGQALGTSTPTEAKPSALPSLSGAQSPSETGEKLPALGSYCSGCGNPIHPQAVVCPRCGVATATAAQATGAAVQVALNAKSTGLAITLSLLFTGAGHWYVGRVGRGIAFFAAAFVSAMLIYALVGLFLLPIVWVWAAVDANKCAQQHNRLLMAQVGSPAAGMVLPR